MPKSHFPANQFLNREQFLPLLQQLGADSLVDRIQQICPQKFNSAHHGSLAKWANAWSQLPDYDVSQFILDREAVEVCTSEPVVDYENLIATLMEFHPWRKGPFRLFGLDLDCEWRSCLKWDRLANHIDFQGKKVLDVGCGNGYYGWRMLGAGADWVLGCEPYLLSIAQFEVFRKYWQAAESHCIVPLSDTDLPRDLRCFDITVSMGVLYHRPNPIEHLQILRSTLNPGGQLILETLVIEGNEREVLVPDGRYAKMRNVWFIPSVGQLQNWLRRCGFRNIETLAVASTTSEEQRRTRWMTFESLADFLDASDATKTIEGYPAPRRALLTAQIG